MPYRKVIGVFDDHASLERAAAELRARRLVTGGTLRVDPEILVEDLHPPEARPRKNLLERFKTWWIGEDEEADSLDLQGGRSLLVLLVCQEDAPKAAAIMRGHGAGDFRHEMWESQLSPHAAAAAADHDHLRHPVFNVRLSNESNGQTIGWISDEELTFLQNALEGEGPDDTDFWINPDTIDMIECRLGATAHLIGLLRDAVRDHEDGIDIAFQREGQPLQSLRRKGPSPVKGKESAHRRPTRTCAAAAPESG